MGKSVFLSYVHNDTEVVQRFAKELQNRGIEVWLDREQIMPGQYWQDAIDKAIKEGAYFVPCYSQSLIERDRSFMHSELRFAIDRLREMPRERIWFVPVFLNETTIPNHRISSFETLSSIHTIDLFTDWGEGIERILDAMDMSDASLRKVRKIVNDLDGEGNALQGLCNLVEELRQSVPPRIASALFCSDTRARRISMDYIAHNSRAACEALKELTEFVDVLAKDPEVLKKFVNIAFLLDDPILRLGPIASQLSLPLMALVEESLKSRAGSSFIKKLRRSEDLATVRSALRYIAKIATPESGVFDFYRKLLETDDDKLREETINSIGKMGIVARPLASDVLQLLSGSSADNQSSLLEALGKMKCTSGEIVNTFLEYSTSKNANVKVAAASAIGDLCFYAYSQPNKNLLPEGEPLVARLFEMVLDDVKKVRNAAIYELGFVDVLDTKDNAKVIPLLSHPKRKIRMLATESINSLGLGNEALLRALVDNLSDKDNALIKETLFVLRDVTNAPDYVIEKVLELLSSPSQEVSKEAFSTYDDLLDKQIVVKTKFD